MAGEVVEIMMNRALYIEHNNTQLIDDPHVPKNEHIV